VAAGLKKNSYISIRAEKAGRIHDPAINQLLETVLTTLIKLAGAA